MNLAFAGMIALCTFGAPEFVPVPVKVADEAGAPIAGAKVWMDGYLADMKNGGTAGARVDVSPEGMKTTDADGVAHINVPKHLLTETNRFEMDLSANHPDYIPGRAYGPVQETGPTVVLKKCAGLKVAGYTGPDKKPFPNPIALLNRHYTRNDPAPDGSILLKGIKDGESYLRLGGRAEDGRLYYSDGVSVALENGEIASQELELKPGLPLRGHIDPSVPRPIRNGRVLVLAGLGEQGAPVGDYEPLQEVPGWVTAADIAPDGTFAFPSLPPGTLELFAFAEGFVSGNPPSAAPNAVCPITFLLGEDSQEAVVPMDPLTPCKITVTDPNGKRLANAEVQILLPIAWRQPRALRGARTANFRMEDSEKPMPSNGKEPFSGNSYAYRVLTDERGVAELPDLLPRQNIPYSIKHPARDYTKPETAESAFVGQGLIDLKPGKTLALTVQLHENLEKSIR